MENATRLRHQEIHMSRLIRLSIHAVSFLALPAAALILGLRALDQREHPRLLPRMDAAAVALVPRPAIDTARPTVVVLLGSDLTEITDALGPYEMFARAGMFNVVTAAATRQPTLLTGGIRILPHYSLPEIDAALGRAPAMVVVPNLPNAGAPINRPLIEWIRQQAVTGSLIHSWCKGAMALAETGLLDGQTATAHWGDIPELEKRYPKVTWVRGVRWIDRRQYVLSAGITSGIDASLRVLIRIAGDSVARRVAREIRYPNYHFAIDPRVDQYSLRPADLVLLANAAFRVHRPLLGVGIYDGVAELDLSSIYDAHAHTMVMRVETLALTNAPVVTAHALTLYPSLTVGSTGAESRVRALDRLMVPGVDARVSAAPLVAALGVVRPELRPEYVHADHPTLFGLAPVVEDLARTADVPTARFALKRMEFRSATVSFEGSTAPWAPIGTALLLAVAGLGLAAGALRVVSRPKVSESRLAQRSRRERAKSYVAAALQRGLRAMSHLTRLFTYVAYVAVVTMTVTAIACSDAPTSPIPSQPGDPSQPGNPPKPAPAVATVTLDATELSLDEGASRQIVATPRDAQGAAISGLAITWTSSDAAIVGVDDSGRLSAIRAGTALLRATVQGLSAQATVTVSANYPFDLLYTVQTFDIFREAFRLDVGEPSATPERLLPQQQWASQVRPSPDGTRIAYVCPNPIIGDPSICVANRDGSGSTMIAAFIGEAFQEPAWNPDGTRIAFVRTKNDGIMDRSHVWVVNADGTNQVPLTADMPGNQNMPAWSPRLADGTERVAFVQDVNLQPRIWTARADGSDRRPLGSASEAYDVQPAWSPDGTTIAFQRTTATIAADIWLMNADGSAQRPLMPLLPLAGLQLSPTWSPDGRLIAFTSRHETSASGYQVYTVWTDGSKLARRTFDAGDKATPAWIPVSP
jgi:AraC family transcriptional regulator, transcriptional activator FtrA